MNLRQAKLRAVVRNLYHRAPLSQSLKWRLRARLAGLYQALENPSLESFRKGLRSAVSGASSDSGIEVDHRAEAALVAIIEGIARHVRACGPLGESFALPFLASGGAEKATLNMCRAARQLQPDRSVLLFVTDRGESGGHTVVLPDGVIPVFFDDYVAAGSPYAKKQALLWHLLVALRPARFHNVNSEVAWHLILEKGERLKALVPLYASIFAFQFASDRRTKIGYAAYFLKDGMPSLTGLFSDNQRFIEDAAKEYQFSPEVRARMHVLYQPCLNVAPVAVKPHVPVAGTDNKRLKVVWAGRLDAEKRIDLFYEVVRACPGTDFVVHGQVVLGSDGVDLPTLPNLVYAGPFTSPAQWIAEGAVDAFMFTSRWEGMPNVLLEAGLLGLPVIAPVVGGVAELINESTGFALPEQATVADYQSALKALAGDRADSVRKATQLQSLILDRHSWAAFVARYQALGQASGLLPSTETHAQAQAGTDAHASSPGHLPASGQPLVSVIVPCFNQGQYLYECVESVLAACTQPLEIIIIDDGSTDPKTAGFLREVQALAPDLVHVHRQANGGLSSARNKGVSLARGAWVQLLDADDLLTAGKIDAQVAQLETNPGLSVSVCNFLLCDEARNVYSKQEEAVARFDLDLSDFLYRWERGFVIPIHAGLFRREILLTHGFDETARAKEDWLFWTGMSMDGIRIAYLGMHGAVYRQHDSSMRRSYVRMGESWLRAGLKIQEKLGAREPLFFESVVSWFEQCYRAHPAYRAEIAERQSQLAAPAAVSAPAKNPEAPLESVGNHQALFDALRTLAVPSARPLFSVIVPVYGHYQYLEACLKSLVGQGVTDMEIICIDDASPDRRVPALLRDVAACAPAFRAILLDKNGGISAAQNRAVAEARGEYLAFLDCDDWLEPGALSLMAGEIRQHPRVDYFFTDRREMDANDNLVRIARYGGYDNIPFTSQENIRRDLLDGMIASHLKVIRRSAYLETGGCDDAFSGVQDWHLALKIACLSDLRYVDKVVYSHRIHVNSVTRSALVSQFRKTNVLRRAFMGKWLGKGDPAGKGRTFVTFSAEEFPLPLERLKTVWSDGGRCAIRIADRADVPLLNFLREFNSYFDRIECDDPTILTSLHGYLWNPSIVQAIGSSREVVHTTEYGAEES